MLLMIDNYDSFTYNLVQYFGELGEEVEVFRNDEITVAEITALKPARICISPGPCDPSQAGVSLELIQELADSGVHPVDVHLLTAGTLQALERVCRPGIARVTFPFEDVPDAPAIAAQIRAAGVRPWLAIAPNTSLEACAETLPHVDGLLVMLLEPGTSGRSDPAQLTKVRRACALRPVGVDGGVGESNVGDVLAAGASYVVIGRRLFALGATSSNEDGVEHLRTQGERRVHDAVIGPGDQRPHA